MPVSSRPPTSASSVPKRRSAMRSCSMARCASSMRPYLTTSARKLSEKISMVLQVEALERDFTTLSAAAQAASPARMASSVSRVCRSLYAARFSMPRSLSARGEPLFFKYSALAETALS